MYCSNTIPLGGRVHLHLSSGRSFSRSRSSFGRLGRGVLSGIWALAPHPRCLGHGGIQRAEVTGGSVGNSPGRARSPVFDGNHSWAGPRPWQDPEDRGYWCVSRSIGIFARWDGQVYVAPVRTGWGVNQACPMSRTIPSTTGQWL